MSKCKITFYIGSEEVAVEVDSTQLPQNLEELKDSLKNNKEIWKDAKSKIRNALINRKKAPFQKIEELEKQSKAIPTTSIEVLRSKLIHMSIYPTILVAVLVVEFMLFGLGIFPTMVENFQIDQVPPIAMAFMAGANAVLKLWWLFVFLIIGGWVLLKHTIGFKAIKKSIGNFFAKIPLMKDCLRYFSLSHYMSVLYVAYESGVPIAAALRMAEDTISVDKINEQAKSVTNQVGKGENITDAFYKLIIFI